MTIFRRRRAVAELLEAERRRARAAVDAETAEKARLRTTLDALRVGVVLVDRNGATQVSNRAANLSGHEGVLVGEALDKVLRQVDGGGPASRTVEFFGPPRRVVLLRAERLASGDVLATIDDISERARLDAVRTDFVANISHELKTPIGALSVLAEALADCDDPDVVHRLADKMIGEAHRVSHTIDDLMELSRIELGGEAVHELVLVDAVVDGAIDRVETVAVQRQVGIRRHALTPDLKAMGDSRQLVSAVANLLDNAVKYSEPGSAVRVGAQLRDAMVEITVDDRGIGIPAREHDRIFERFYRVDRARSRETGGTGLGLAIVRHVATNHGGEVLVRSQEGVGSTFTLRVPASHG
jgi:two-component system sensor histidine kinase SenX3